MLNNKELAALIDHTNLKPGANLKDILQTVNEALQFNFYSVCIYPFFIPLIKNLLKNSNVKICTVIAFPHGSSNYAIKTEEALNAISQGADEIDMLINLAAFKSGMYNLCENEIRFVRNQIPPGIILKVIVETALLSESELTTAAQIVLNSGADFIKTSTGFASRGASVRDIEIIKNCIGNQIGIKASGGIDSRTKALQLIEFGATRLGSSKSLKIIEAE